VVFLGYQYFLLNKESGSQRQRMLDEIRARGDTLSPRHYDNLWQLFRSAKRRITTEHVIAESRGSRNPMRSYPRERVWQAAIVLLNFPVEEVSCSVREIHADANYTKILVYLGPADAGLIYVAERQKATILSEDGSLGHWARSRSVPAMSLQEIGFGGT
jgi:hypothetical protein